MRDLAEPALYWSTDRAQPPDKDKFIAFVAGYKDKRGTCRADWHTILDKGFGAKFGWLEYCLKRSFGLEAADEAERQMGTEHVTNTIHMLADYDRMKRTVIDWLENMF